jgi:transcriptional regulator with XRE-family HTH domain
MYKRARKAAGLSIEEAAERIHIGTRTLTNYEGYHTLTPPDVALSMSGVYEQPEIYARYCSEVCPIGQIHAHLVEKKDLASAVLGLIKEHNDVAIIRDKLIEIAADGIINPEEEALFKMILAELDHLGQKIQTINLLAASIGSYKKKKPLKKAAR